ncbi:MULTISPECIES: multidrug effflux MFS transporter [Staphylococcus]|jgi:DHA1 family bicyclomycin/chloramphenicol resistance-like MFS transporter|uniref:Bcr/CflA family efflux transporter n=1 Tax=Staphylococcus haemolyticus TaxID=1283 RepID=A0A2A1KGN2_STAHA|nr:MULTISPECIES: multidrug effflux MFS transporter [Staphylococcus]MDU2097731.1 multidrug effflux MFS transporter [Staphylococcus sp.]AKC75473.1 MFS family major facilitator transporter, teicoplanin:cation symporter [Staphylococcus haemolyticus]AUV66766.1 Bcr/CflA family drug resistance efflux transporter [Staphylococcus haemolyticus]AUV69147.1 Bcr/CflA family drug resistance efflux transporter [Staphylococcus haemolyticus]MBC3012980.1 multidrug effflux MFS transporter [Staphylococcus haemolyt
MDIEQKQKKNSPLFIIILGALTAIGALSIDMFLPGLPELKNDFNTTTANAQLTLSLFMIGLGLGNLFVGPISDSIGRKKPLVISMIIFALASLGIVFVENIWIMVFLRFVQGFTGGAGAVISRAIASDMYRGNELTKFLALLMLVNGVAPVIAPALGGLILSFAVWRMVFVILTLFGVLMVLGSLFKVPESLSVKNRDSSGVNVIFSNFKSLLTTPRFVLPMLIQGVTFIMLFSYISASPFLVQKIYGVSPLHFSWMFAGVGITLIIASQIAGKLVDYFHPQVLLRAFTIIQIIGVVIVSLTLINHWHFALLVIGFIVLVAPVTGVATLGFSIAMEERTTGSGSASSLLGLLQSLLGGLVTPLVNLKGEYNIMPYIIIISLTAILLIILQLLNIKVFKHDKV